MMSKAREVIAGGLAEVLIEDADRAPYLADAVMTILKINGLVILPLEPTEGMIEAALHDHATNAPYKSPFGSDGSFARQYRAMVKAVDQ